MNWKDSSSVDKPDPIIPFRLDAGNAAAVLAKLAAAAKKARQRIDDGAGEGNKAIIDLTGSILGAARTLGTFGMAREAFSAVTDQAKECANYVGYISKDFIGLRQAMQQVAALDGQQKNNLLTREQALSADASSVTPQQWIRFQEQFQFYAGAYIEGDLQRLNAEHTELVSQLLPQMLGIVSRSATPDKPAQLLAPMSEAMPAEEEIGVTNTIKALITAKLEGNGGKFSLKKGITWLQTVESMAKAMKVKESTGADLDLILTDLAPDIRERHGILGLVNRGAKDVGFEQIIECKTQTTVNSMDEAIKAHEASASGKQTRRDADEALAIARASSRSTTIEALRQEARMALIGELPPVRFQVYYFSRSSIGKLPGPSIEDQFANERAFENALDHRGCNRPGLSRRVETRKGISQIHPGATNQFVEDSLRRLVELEEEKARQRRSPPISVPPPTAPNGGRMGGMYH